MTLNTERIRTLNDALRRTGSAVVRSSIASGWRIVGKGEALTHIWSLPFASRLAALLKLAARYSAKNTNLAPEREPVVACRPIKSHRCPLTWTLQ